MYGFFDRSRLSPASHAKPVHPDKKKAPQVSAVVARWLARPKDWRPLHEVLAEARGEPCPTPS